MTLVPHDFFKFFRYSVVGVANTATDFAVFSLLYYCAGLSPLLANCLAFFVAVTQSYLANARWTFKQRVAELKIRAYSYFVTINIGCLGISSATIYLLEGIIAPVLAKLLAAAIVLAWGFLLSRRFVFGEENKIALARIPQARRASE